MKQKIKIFFIACISLVCILFLAAGPKQWLQDRAIEAKKKVAAAASLIQRAGGKVTKKVQKDVSLALVYAKKLKDMEFLEQIWQQFGTPAAQRKLNANNPFKNATARIESSDTLSKEEIAYRKARSSYVAQGFQRYFETEMGNDDYRLAFVGSGGGYRAMILTMGYAKALEDLGLLDATSYFSSLSGSTWFLAPWIFTGGSVNDFRNLMVSKILERKFNLLAAQNLFKADVKQFIETVLWKKFIFGQPIGMVDLYGALLEYVFFSHFGNQRHTMHLSEQQALIKDGSKPFPIYTAVSMHKIGQRYLYNWYAFDPFYVTNLELQKRFKSFAFDSEFQNGSTKRIAPEQSMGFLMGIFGSAFAVNIKDLYRIAFEGVEATEIDTVKLMVARAIFNIARDVRGVGAARVAPAQVFNPFYKHADAPEWFHNRGFITLVDAGIDYNIPIRPVIEPQRGVQTIIIGDSSATIDRDDELQKMFADLKRLYGYTYERLDDGSNITLRLYQDTQHPQAPKIVYINFLIDPKLLERAKEVPMIHAQVVEHRLTQFNILDCLKAFCGTFNFDYDPNELNRLFTVAYVNAYMNLQDQRVKEFIKP